MDDIRVIAAKAEGVYGTDAGPTLAADAVLTRNFQTTPLEVDQINRNLDTNKYGATKGKPSNARVRSSYEVELAGSGAAGTAPAFMRILAACGLTAPALDAGVDARQTFAQIGEVPGSLTEYAWVDDQLRKTLGQRGTFSLDMTAGGLPFTSVQMTGLVPTNAPREVLAPGEADFSAWVEPVEVNNENTVFTLDGYAAIMRSLRIEAGVNINLRNLVGARYVNKGNHSASGTIVIEAPSIAAKDYLATLQNGDLIEWNIVHGLDAGNIIEVGGTKAQITAISETEEDDKVMFSISVLLTVDGGADDLLIIAR